MTQPYKLLDLFSGIGGFSLGLERTGGFETVAFCEIEDFPRRVLAKHWPKVPCYHDIRELTAERLAADGIAVDAICGGFPCQPFSGASRGRRTAFDFWPEMYRVVKEVRPAIVIAENVVSKPIERARQDLERIGYGGTVSCISAGSIGADHTRSRWWLCAYADQNGQFHSSFNAEVAQLSAIRSGVWNGAYQPQRLRTLDGISNRLDRVAALGNAVVPQIPELIGNAIFAARGASA